MVRQMLPVDIVLAPEWWHSNAGITFDRDFFFHPLKRMESEQRMEKVLHERWGKYGLGEMKDEKRPEVGAVHLASGFMIQEMLGCEVRYFADHPPQVISPKREDLYVDTPAAFRSEAFREFSDMMDKMKEKKGFLTGDVNWSGILNLALDLRGEELFTDIMMKPEAVNVMFADLAGVIGRFTSFIQAETGSSSISVNRNVRNLRESVFLHSECSHTMISIEDYERDLLRYDIEWSMQRRPFGVHYCGNDPHRYAESFARIPHLDFLDLGWGGDVKKLRQHLPRTFFNLRLSPVEIGRQPDDELRETIIRLVTDSGDPWLTGVCCINMDDKVSDAKISVIFETVEELRKQYR